MEGLRSLLLLMGRLAGCYIYGKPVWAEEEEKCEKKALDVQLDLR
jgi:hypothetical protein